MAIKIQNSTIIDDSRNIINSTAIGIGTTNPTSKLHVVPTSTSIAGLFSGTTSSDMVCITQTGTGNALVVEDETNPDSTPFVVKADGSVGVGTTNPTSKLKVESTSQQIGAWFSGNTIEDMIRITQYGVGDALVIESLDNDSSPFVVRADGSVGIGTVNPTTKLDVRGDLRVNDGNLTVGPGVGLSVYAAYSRQLSPQVGTAITNQALTANSTRTTDAAIYDYIWDNYSVYDADGDGVVSSNDALVIIRYLFGSAFQGDALISGITFPSNATRTTATSIRNYIGLHTMGGTGKLDVDGNGDVTALGDGLMISRVFQGGSTNPADNAPAKFVTDAYFNVNSAGLVGIGTLNASAKLDVVGNLRVVPTSTSIAGLFSGTTSSDMVRITQTGTGNALVVEDETNPDATPFVVTATGSVGVGTITPSAKLDVVGTVESTGLEFPTGGYFRSTGLGGTKSDVSIELRPDNTTPYLMLNARSIPSTNNWNSITLDSNGFYPSEGNIDLGRPIEENSWRRAYFKGAVGVGTTTLSAMLTVNPSSTGIAGLFSGTTSNDMVRITQLGTGNALDIHGDTNVYINSEYKKVGIYSGSLTTSYDDEFGQSLAITPDGSCVVVGSTGDELTGTTGNGLAYVFDYSVGVGYTQVGILSATSGTVSADASDKFGCTVAISHDRTKIAVGAYSDEFTTGTTNIGLVHVFERPGGTGTTFNNIGILSATSSTTAVNSSDQFGRSISMSGDGSCIVVGSVSDEFTTGTADAGLVYVFDYSVGVGYTQVGILSATSDTTAQTGSDQFGRSVAMTDDKKLIVVGAPDDEFTTGTTNIGLAYVFERPNGTGNVFNRVGILSASPGLSPSGNDNVGYSVDITPYSNNATIIVGSPSFSAVSGSRQGYVFVYDRNGATNTFNQVGILSSGKFSTTGTDDNFGTGIKISEDGQVIVVGATSADLEPLDLRGGSYVFKRNAPVGSSTTSFTLTQRLFPDGVRPVTGAGTGDYSVTYGEYRSDFGWAIGITTGNNRLLISGPLDSTSSTASNGGRVLHFELQEQLSIVTDSYTGFVGIGSSIPTTKLDVTGEITATTYRVKGTDYQTYDPYGFQYFDASTKDVRYGYIDVDASKVQMYAHIGSISGVTTVRVSNLTEGKFVDLYLRNTNATARTISIKASTLSSSIFNGTVSDGAYSLVNLAPSTPGAASVTSVSLAANTGTAHVWVANIGGQFVGSI